LIAIAAAAMLIVALIPAGILNAYTLTDEDMVPNKIINGDFEAETEGPQPPYWTSSMSENALVSVVTDGSGHAIELYSPEGKEDSTSYAEISEFYIPITTNNLTYSVEIKPAFNYQGKEGIFFGTNINFFDADKVEIGSMSNNYSFDDFPVDHWTTVSLNFAGSDMQTNYFDPGKSSKDAAYILVHAFVNSENTGNDILVLFDNFRLSPNIFSPLTPAEWVALDLNVQQLRDHYGPTPPGFINMLYDNSLQRVPDEEGLNYWNAQLTGNNFSANQIVEQLIFSDELGAKVNAMANEEFITFLYRSLLSRTPDADGYNNWLSFMAAGNSKLDTLKAFLNNEEWISICAMFNVAP
jgi:hypothetical protein